MLISPIANKTAISKIQSNNTENKEISSQKTVTTLPSFADAKSLVNINFKARIHDCVVNGYWHGIQEELDKGVSINMLSRFGITPLIQASSQGRTGIVEKLLQHPDIDVNAQDQFGNTPLIIASFHKRTDVVRKILEHPDVNINLKDSEGRTALYYAIDPEIAKMIEDYVPGVDRRGESNQTQGVSDINAKDKDGRTALIRACGGKKLDEAKQLLQHPDIDVNAQDKVGNTALILACYYGHTEIVEKLFQHSDIDINLKDCYGHTALYWARENNRSEIAKMIEDYVPEVDRREGVIKAKKTKQIDVEKLTSFKEIWSDEEKQNIAKMVEDKDYDGLAKVFESKGTELNGRYEQLINDINSIKEAAEKSARKTETEKIREEERIAAEEKVADKLAELDKSKAEYEEKNKALDNLINDYQSMLADDVEAAKSGFRALYDIKSEDLPEKMDLGEQMIYVIDIMSNNRNKLANMNEDSPEKITKALQDNNGQISADGLKFLERVIKVSDRSCSENDLISSINSVKDKNGHIDMKKVSYFIANLSWGQRRIPDVIQKVEQYNN